MTKTKNPWCFATLALLASAAFSTSSCAVVSDLKGVWGGDQLQLVVDHAGVRLEHDCAGGAIAGPVSVNAEGHFTAQGTFDQHQPGPQAADGPAPNAVRFSGVVKGDTLQLTVTPQRAGPVQVFNLRKDVRVKLRRCL